VKKSLNIYRKNGEEWRFIWLKNKYKIVKNKLFKKNNKIFIKPTKTWEKTFFE
jgi:galactose-1-phosphate uridylyltransferase